MAYVYDLTLGLPHTNHRGLSELHLLQYAGHYQWMSIAAAAGVPLSQLRTASGGEVYASFYYIEEWIPAGAPLESFGLDDTIRFAIALRSFKNIAIEGRVVFDRPERISPAGEVPAGDVPSIRFANIFITPEKGNSRLRVAPPHGVDFSQLPHLPSDENPYQLTQAASESGTLGLLDRSWQSAGEYEHRYPIDADRDTNGAALVYFANYLAFMDAAERHALAAVFPADDRTGAMASRSLRHRRIAYYGNAEVEDTLVIRVATFHAGAATLGFRYQIQRQEDQQIICLSEAIKSF